VWTGLHGRHLQGWGQGRARQGRRCVGDAARQCAAHRHNVSGANRNFAFAPARETASHAFALLSARPCPTYCGRHSSHNITSAQSTLLPFAPLRPSLQTSQQRLHHTRSLPHQSPVQALASTVRAACPINHPCRHWLPLYTQPAQSPNHLCRGEVCRKDARPQHVPEHTHRSPCSKGGNRFAPKLGEVEQAGLKVAQAPRASCTPSKRTWLPLMQG